MEKKRNVLAGLCLLLAMWLFLLWNMIYYVPEGETVFYLEQSTLGPSVHKVSGPAIIWAFQHLLPVYVIRGKFGENFTSRLRQANESDGQYYSGEATYQVRFDYPWQFYNLYDFYEQSRDLEKTTDNLVRNLFAERLNALLAKGFNCSSNKMAGCKKAYLENGTSEYLDPRLEYYGIYLQNLSVYSSPAWPVNLTAEN